MQRRSKKCNSDREDNQVLVTTWKKQVKTAGPEHCNPTPENPLLLGAHSILVLICTLFRNPY